MKVKLISQQLQQQWNGDIFTTGKTHQLHDFIMRKTVNDWTKTSVYLKSIDNHVPHLYTISFKVVIYER